MHIIIIIIMCLSYGGRCRSYELAPCLPILSSVIGSCQTNVQGRQVIMLGQKQPVFLVSRAFCRINP